jgi:hypothetical protein
MNYAHLEKLIARIKERPAHNVDLDTFLSYRSTPAQVAIAAQELENNPPNECGAVGCIAGYAATLTDNLICDPDIGVMFLTTAHDYLDITPAQSEDLFDEAQEWEVEHFADDHQAIALERLDFLKQNEYFDAEQFKGCFYD